MDVRAVRELGLLLALFLAPVFVMVAGVAVAEAVGHLVERVKVAWNGSAPR